MLMRNQQIRSTSFAPRLQALLHDHRGKDAFRLEPRTIGVAGPELIDRILAARPATEFERPTFKPLHGRSIPRTDALRSIQAIGKDVRSALKKPLPDDVDLSGEWPHVGHNYLRDFILGRDPGRLQFLMNRVLELTPKLTWSVIAAGAMPRLRLKPGASQVAVQTANASGYHDRRYAMGLYRRTAAPICFTISTLVANALWLGAPFDDDMPNRNILFEALRLLPPSWNILRYASVEYTALDERIGSDDDILILPLLSHRDPALWDEADAFRPERWNTLDPDNHPGFVPFGHRSERCWGQNMVMPLAGMLLDMLRANNFSVDPNQRKTDVPLDGLLGVTGIRVVRH